ncbi:DUF6891 domain-containing protein [Trinickia fusca]|uniref:DUF6891 domain-containing protein n=1 Tax=Trinickia fusca TaxID=2419777 RepID=A0A494XD59_9BURK|nr:hypothetical protein [Trinickia fusca]RKP47591.1 hypothetical protein D7S89_15305 [Trinickia fusca]
MNENEQYVLQCIKNWVWSGFYTSELVHEMLEDVLDDECDEELLRDLIDPEFEKKAEAEATWPATTDYDRLNQVFDVLHEKGICALHNAGYTMSDGFSDVSEAIAAAPPGEYQAFCFYHGQDVERAIAGHGLMLAFGSLDTTEANSLAAARVIVDDLREAGFKVVWDGTVNTRISLPELDWKKRQESR